jgi:hypothetical protein
MMQLYAAAAAQGRQQQQLYRSALQQWQSLPLLAA